MGRGMTRILSLELARVTEAAALSSARWMGRGEKDAADQAAVDAMRAAFDTIYIDGVVVIGEGELDEAPMLYIGEQIGKGGDVQVDVAVDPVEGTELVAKGLPNSIAVVAIAPRGSLLHAPDMYMDKLAVGPEAAGKIDINKSPTENLQAIAEGLGKHVCDLTAVILDRPRHDKLIQEVRETGARIKLIRAGDVAPAVATGFKDSGIDVLMGIGGAPEGVLAAAALKCVGGEMQARLWPETEEEVKRTQEMMGTEDVRKVLYMDDLVKGEDVIFAATGITDGDLLRGVRFLPEGAKTHTLVMRGRTGTIRFIEATHQFKKKKCFP